MNFNLQPTLENEWVRIQPLQFSDFEALYRCASDPLIWEQHPEKKRYQLPVFRAFFEEAMQSGGAFLVLNRKTGDPIGTSRYYDLKPDISSIAIGYTFLVRACWGTTFNRALKILMLDHAFTFVDYVIFHIGPHNIRSQAAVLKLGARKLEENEVAQYGLPKADHFVYVLNKADWVVHRADKFSPLTKSGST